MKRIYISALGLFSFYQIQAQQIKTDSASVGKLKVDEVNLVSSYYKQDGNNSAVTGGIGTEKLTDISNIINVKLIRYDKKKRKHTFGAELGIDHYTSASSDMIDLKANSSASSQDIRVYPSLSWQVENEEKGNSFMAGVSSSTEYDYQSFGANIGFSKKTTNKMGELTANLHAYIDQVKLIAPVELRNGTTEDNGTDSRNTFAASLSYSQIINANLQLVFLVDAVQQNGLLSLPFHRVYFSDGGVHQEKLPDNRFKLPLGFRANYFLGDRFIIRTYYRYYTDNWGINSHTFNIETPVKLSPFVSLSPFYRYYTQTAVKYFGAYQTHNGSNGFYTSNYDLSGFNSQFFGMGARFNLPNGLLGISKFNMIEIRYGHYTKTTGMKGDIISLNLKFK